MRQKDEDGKTRWDKKPGGFGMAYRGGDRYRKERKLYLKVDRKEKIKYYKIRL